MRFRYTGALPTSFQSPGQAFSTPEMLAGGEFDVPIQHAQSFAQHGLLEPADDEARDLVAQMAAPPAEPAPEAVVDGTDGQPPDDTGGDASGSAGEDNDAAPSDADNTGEPSDADTEGQAADVADTAPPPSIKRKAKNAADATS